MSKKKWGHEESSSDMSPKDHKRVYKKMKVADRQASKKSIGQQLIVGLKEAVAYEHGEIGLRITKKKD